MDIALVGIALVGSSLVGMNVTGYPNKRNTMFYWIKSDATSATTTYLYNPLTGTKRAITASEWAVVTTFDPTLKVVVIKDTAIAAIPTVK